MIATIQSATLLGVTGHPVSVEVHVGKGLPGYHMVGLADLACRESRDRVRAAILSSGLRWPDVGMTVNPAPASVRRPGRDSTSRERRRGANVATRDRPRLVPARRGNDDGRPPASTRRAGRRRPPAGGCRRGRARRRSRDPPPASPRAGPWRRALPSPRRSPPAARSGDGARGDDGPFGRRRATPFLRCRPTSGPSRPAPLELDGLAGGGRLPQPPPRRGVDRARWRHPITLEGDL